MKTTAMLIILLAATLPSLAMAQQPAETTFIVITNPAGATVYLDGEYHLVASTPASLPSNLSGQYKTKIIRPGYESWRGELTFVPGMPNTVNIDLKKKTAFKAGLRSLIVPGWGQYYSGNKVRGSLFTLGAVSALTGLYFADKKYQDKRADYDIASQAYVNATSIEERIRLKEVKDAKQRLAYSAETDRRTVFYIGVGLWTFNFLDAILFFPDGEAVFPTVSAIDGGGAMLTLQARF